MLWLCVVSLIVSLLNPSISPEKVIKRVQKKFDSIRDFSAEFQETFHWELAGETHSVKGKIYLKGGEKFRLETEDQIIVSDGKTLWTYSPVNNQVIIDDLEKTEETLLPRDLLFKYAREYSPHLLTEERIKGRRIYKLELIPKDRDEFIQRMEVWVDGKDWITRKISYLDINGNKRIYEISNIRINQGLEEGLFIFKIPQGVEIIDMR